MLETSCKGTENKYTVLKSKKDSFNVARSHCLNITKKNLYNQ